MHNDMTGQKFNMLTIIEDNGGGVSLKSLKRNTKIFRTFIQKIGCMERNSRIDSRSYT